MSIVSNCSPEWLHPFTTPPAVHSCPNFATSLPTFTTFPCCHVRANLLGVGWYLRDVVIYIFSNYKQPRALFFMCLVILLNYLSENCLLPSLCPLENGFFFGRIDLIPHQLEELDPRQRFLLERFPSPPLPLLASLLIILVTVVLFVEHLFEFNVIKMIYFYIS